MVLSRRDVLLVSVPWFIGPASGRAMAETPAALYDQGLRAAGAGDVVAAMAAFTRALEADPSHAPSALARGRLFIMIGEPKLAVADLTTAVLVEPGNALALALRGDAKANLKDEAGAVADYDAAVALAPENAEILVMRATHRLKAGALALAREDLVRARAFATGADATRIDAYIRRLGASSP